MQPIRLLVAGAIAIWLASCAATPSPSVSTADPHRYAELVPGTSTRDDAVAKLGPPCAVTALQNDQVLLQWCANVYLPHPIQLAIRFGPDGKMIRVESVITPQG